MLNGDKSQVVLCHYIMSSKSDDVPENAITNGNKRRHKSAEQKMKTLPVVREEKLAEIDAQISTFWQDTFGTVEIINNKPEIYHCVSIKSIGSSLTFQSQDCYWESVIYFPQDLEELM